MSSVVHAEKRPSKEDNSNNSDKSVSGSSPLQSPIGKDVPLPHALVLSHDVYRQLLTMVGLPLLILSAVAIGYILVQGKDILQPLCIAVFFTYLIRPFITLLTIPLDWCFGKIWDNGCSRGDRSCEVLPVQPNEERGQYSDSDEEAPLTGPRRRGRVGEDQAREEEQKEEEEPAFTYSGEKGKHGEEEKNVSIRIGKVKIRGRAGKVKGFFLPRAIAVILALSIVICIIVFSVLLLVNTIESFQKENITLYEQQAAVLKKKFLDWMSTHLHMDGSDALTRMTKEVSIATVFGSVLSFAFNAVTGFFVVLLFILYLAFENSNTYGKESIPGKIDDQISQYIVMKTFISLVAGFLVWIILGPILHVRLSLLFAVLTFFFNYIPNVGAFIAVFLPLPIVLFDPSFSFTRMALAFALPIVVHMIVGNILEPKVFGTSMDTHPIFLLLSLAFWFAVWGVPGAILSVPMTAVIRIILSHSKHPYAKVILSLMEGHMFSLLV